MTKQGKSEEDRSEDAKETPSGSFSREGAPSEQQTDLAKQFSRIREDLQGGNGFIMEYVTVIVDGEPQTIKVQPAMADKIEAMKPSDREEFVREFSMLLKADEEAIKKLVGELSFEELMGRFDERAKVWEEFRRRFSEIYGHITNDEDEETSSSDQ